MKQNYVNVRTTQEHLTVRLKHHLKIRTREDYLKLKTRQDFLQVLPVRIKQNYVKVRTETRLS